MVVTFRRMLEPPGSQVGNRSKPRRRSARTRVNILKNFSSLDSHSPSVSQVQVSLLLPIDVRPDPPSAL